MIFLTGGARSGKSNLAIELAQAHDGPVRYVVTARPTDDEMEKRIESHRRSRPRHWAVVEAPVALVEGVNEAEEGDLVVIDCVTLWISNLMEDRDDPHILSNVEDVVTAVVDRRPSAIVISNEVGSGLVPMSPVGRRFRDLQGAVNQRFAAAAERAYLVVAGKALRLNGSGEI